MTNTLIRAGDCTTDADGPIFIFSQPNLQHQQANKRRVAHEHDRGQEQHAVLHGRGCPHHFHRIHRRPPGPGAAGGRRTSSRLQVQARGGPPLSPLYYFTLAPGPGYPTTDTPPQRNCKWRTSEPKAALDLQVPDAGLNA